MLNLEETDPIIVDLLEWLKVNLPPDIDQEALFRRVHRVQTIFDKLMAIAVESIYKLYQDKNLEESVSLRLQEMREYPRLHEEKEAKIEKLNQNTIVLGTMKKYHDLLKSINLDNSINLLGRYNNLMEKN